MVVPTIRKNKLATNRDIFYTPLNQNLQISLGSRGSLTSNEKIAIKILLWNFMGGMTPTYGESTYAGGRNNKIFSPMET